MFHIIHSLEHIFHIHPTFHTSYSSSTPSSTFQHPFQPISIQSTPHRESLSPSTGGDHSTLNRGSLLKSHGRRRNHTPPREAFHLMWWASYSPTGSVPPPRGGNHTPLRGVFHPQEVGFILPHGEPSTPRVGRPPQGESPGKYARKIRN
jgi:hypothetical protein